MGAKGGLITLPFLIPKAGKAELGFLSSAFLGFVGAPGATAAAGFFFFGV